MIKAILVDDDETDGFLLESALHHVKPDLAVFRVKSAKEAIDLIIADAPDDHSNIILVTDLMMPGTEGTTLIRWAKSHLSIEPSQIFAFTDTTDGSLKRKAIESGAVMVLNKPDSYSDLLDVADYHVGDLFAGQLARVLPA